MRRAATLSRKWIEWRDAAPCSASLVARRRSVFCQSRAALAATVCFRRVSKKQKCTELRWHTSDVVACAALVCFRRVSKKSLPMGLRISVRTSSTIVGQRQRSAACASARAGIRSLTRPFPVCGSRDDTKCSMRAGFGFTRAQCHHAVRPKGPRFRRREHTEVTLLRSGRHRSVDIDGPKVCNCKQLYASMFQKCVTVFRLMHRWSKSV